MNEIKQRAEFARKYTKFINIMRITNRREWYIYIGLYETAGWVDDHNMLEWVKPGYKDI